MSAITSIPAANSYEGTFITALNFPPQDFSFYQRRPPIFGNRALTEDRLRGAFQFDEYHTYVQKASCSLNGGSTLDTFTIECWFKAHEGLSSYSNQTILAYTDTYGYSVYLRNPSNLSLYCSGLSSSAITTNRNLVDGLWHHVAVVFSKNNPVAIYIDTREVTLSQAYNYTTSLHDGGTLMLGNVSASSSTYFFTNGLVGQARMWMEARTLPDIIYCAGRYLSQSEMTHLSLYWSDEFDPATNTITDSSGHSNNGTASHTTQTNVWNLNDHYGMMVDPSLLLPGLTTMTGNAVMDGTTTQFVKTNLSMAMSKITMECWVKADSAGVADTEIVGLYDVANSKWICSLRNPTALTLHFSGSAIPDIVTTAALMDGNWHHVAVTWSSGQPPVLYLDAVVVPYTAATGVAYSWDTTLSNYKLYLGGGTTNYTLTGGIAELRFWNTIRSQDNIVSDATYRLQNPVSGLQIYWPFARTFVGQATVEDMSGNGRNGILSGNPGWDNTEIYGLAAESYPVAPVPDSSSNAGAPTTSWQYNQLDTTYLASGGVKVEGAAPNFPSLSVDQLREAFTDAQESGYFDALVFPNIYFTETQDRVDAQASIGALEFDTFLQYWVQGRRLSFYRSTGGAMYYKFVPVPDVSAPTLLLIFDTRLMSYYGNIGEGQVVRTFSLMPGESTYASIETYKNTEENAEKASSVFDSTSSSAEESFENSVNMEAGVDSSVDAALDLHGAVETKARWGVGNVDVNASANASISANLRMHLQRISNAMQSHAAQRSRERNVEVNTSYTVTSESGVNTSMTREFRNINNSTTLNILFRQMTQEFKVANVLTNIRIGYYDPIPGSYRSVQLPQLNYLLDQVLLDDAALKSQYLSKIINIVHGVYGFNVGNINNDFLMYLNTSTGASGGITGITSNGTVNVTPDMVFYVNASAFSHLQVTSTESAAINGLVMSQDSILMRTDNIVADLVMGEGSGLDSYAQSLQTQAVRRETVENDRIEAENNRVNAALQILQKANAEGYDADKLAALYHDLFVNSVPNKTVIYKNGTADATTNGTAL